MPAEKCPFCTYWPTNYESMIKHIRRRHCPGAMPVSGGLSCFCGVFWLEQGMPDCTMHKHFEQCGGLRQHATDFLMGVREGQQ